MAAGHAIGRGAPSLALLHSTPGARQRGRRARHRAQNRAPLVVLVGQQDRRHLALEPFLAGRLHGPRGRVPGVESTSRCAPQDVPGAIVRAYHEAATGRGPGDRDRADGRLARARRPSRTRSLGPDAAAALGGGRRGRRRRARGPARAAPTRRRSSSARAPTARRAGRRSSRLPSGWRCPVFQEPFGGQAGFPQDHPLFAGHLPARRARLREVLAPTTSCSSSAPGALRQYPYDAGPAGRARARGSRSSPRTRRRRTAAPPSWPCSATPAAICAALAAAVDAAPRRPAARPARAPTPPEPPAAGEPLRAGHVLAALAERLPRDAILVEETPSSRPELHARIPATEPLGFISAMGMLGFALPAAIGVRMARPDRPVLAVVGDGSSLYQIQALWSAARYGVGVLFVVLANGGYAIMDRLAERNGARRPVAADRLGRHRRDGARARAARECASTHDELLERLDARAAGARRPHRAAAARGRRRAGRDVRPVSAGRRESRCSSPRAPRGCSGASPAELGRHRPWWSTTTRSQSDGELVEQISTGAPAAAAERISACISALAPTSTPRVGSSSRITEGGTLAKGVANCQTFIVQQHTAE